MKKIIGVIELQRRFQSIFDEGIRKQTPVILTRGSLPEAVLISSWGYQEKFTGKPENYEA